MTDDFITALVADHRAVRPFRVWPGWAIAATGVVAGAIACHLAFGIRPDILTGAPSESVLIRSAALLIVGLASLFATVSLSRPGVGKAADGWLWVGAFATIFPLTAIFYFATGRMPDYIIHASSGIRCLIASTLIALAIGTGLVTWLRRAAPVRPSRIGWTVGLASGALGTLAYSLTCPGSGMAYPGVWYTGAVMISALAWRFTVPRLLRW